MSNVELNETGSNFQIAKIEINVELNEARIKRERTVYHSNRLETVDLAVIFVDLVEFGRNSQRKMSSELRRAA